MLKTYSLQIADLEIVTFYDSLEDPFRTLTLRTNRSNLIMREIWNACRKHAYVSSLRIRGVDVDPSALARLNWFLHVPGFKNGFRGMRMALMKEQSGYVM